MKNKRTPDPVLKLNWIAAQDVVYQLQRELAQAQRELAQAAIAMVKDEREVMKFNAKNSNQV